MKFNYIKLLNRNTPLLVIKRLFAKGSKFSDNYFARLILEGRFHPKTIFRTLGLIDDEQGDQKPEVIIH